MHIAHLARAENELLASALEDKLRFVFREHVRGAIVLLRQLLLPLHHFAGEANDHVVLIGLSVDRDGTECGASDLHGLILMRDTDAHPRSAARMRRESQRRRALHPRPQERASSATINWDHHYRTGTECLSARAGLPASASVL